MGYIQNFLLCSLGFYSVTGLAVGYLACYLLLKTVAYLSPWLPVWTWFADFGLFIHAIAISATSIFGIIAALAKKSHALQLCSYILSGLLLVEILATVQLTTRKSKLVTALNSDLRKSMMISEQYYSLNISDTQMWDEIQIEVNCCGVESYRDWFNTSFGAGKNVPDSCCLLVTDHCGQNMASNPNPDDDIITEGCLPTIMDIIEDEYQYYGYYLWLPVLGMQFILIILILYLIRKNENPYIMPSYSFRNDEICYKRLNKLPA